MCSQMTQQRFITFLLGSIHESKIGSQDKRLVSAAFPSLLKNLTPIAAAHGLGSFVLPPTLLPLFLHTAEVVEAVLSSLMEPLIKDPSAFLCLSLDAEWNISQSRGVSVIQLAPHLDPLSVYIIPVSMI